MTTQQLEDQTHQLEARIVILETELRQIRQLLAQPQPTRHPWWADVFGTFANCPDFDAAEQFGRAWRAAQTDGLE